MTAENALGMSHAPARTGWKPGLLIGLNLLALGLLGSLWVPAGTEAWRALDRATFYYLNGTLADGGADALLWAVLNWRPLDVLVGLVLLAVLVVPGPVFARSEIRPAFFGFIAVLALGLLARLGVDHWGLLLERDDRSPTYVLERVHLLSEMFPDLDPKDNSKNSFPGDHAMVLFAWAGYLLIRRVCLGSLAALLFAIFLVAPRLVGGAHWLSDVIVGGGAGAALALGWGACTPYATRAGEWLERWTMPAAQALVGWIPAVSRMSFFSPRGAGSG